MSEMDVPAVPAADEVVAGWFDQHAQALGTYAARRVGANLARDIVAETFRVACEDFDRFDPARGEERAWLFGIATNLIRRHWRTEQRRLRVQADAARTVSRSPIDPILRADERLDARDRLSRVVDAVSLLDAEDRDLLVLVAWEDMTSREAAIVLDIPPGTVRSRLNRIRTRLAETVEEGDHHG